ncbi:hypothetical protein chiPu_0029836 [Chiloscyllium punctatum]|uniref:Uncharacterized protein n=1 Tax=Chiloscyllium punctatum TaxID=137246 RepID=A0A401TSV5_CHIPU|nr:hypothetical protein [Chiloscyllium punctatum]
MAARPLGPDLPHRSGNGASPDPKRVEQLRGLGAPSHAPHRQTAHRDRWFRAHGRRYRLPQTTCGGRGGEGKRGREGGREGDR